MRYTELEFYLKTTAKVKHKKTAKIGKNFEAKYNLGKINHQYWFFIFCFLYFIISKEKVIILDNF